MTPAARTQAAIELLDQIIDAAKAGGAAADTLIARYFATRRYAGSKDRRAVRELVFAAIRRAGEVPVNGRAAILGLAEDQPDLLTHFTGEGHAPATVESNESASRAGVAPSWLRDKLAESGLDEEEQGALLQRAPLDLRVNRLKAKRDEVAAIFTDAQPTPHAPDGLRLAAGVSIENERAYRDGLIEVQDEGSQIVAALCDAQPGMTVIDLCAGAGGKTLALAAAMANQGRLIASDTDRGRLSKLAPRAARAGVTIVEERLLNPKREMETLADLADQADRVLIDAPCSGSGTWRRNPEARWRLTPERIAKYAEAQAYLLNLGASLVKSGGQLTFITCSLFDEEGADQIEQFLIRDSDWQSVALPFSLGTPRGAGIRLTPFQDSTDGFFVATLVRPC